MSGRDRQPLAKDIATVAWPRCPRHATRFSKPGKHCRVASVLRNLPVRIVRERRRPYPAFEASADARTDRTRLGIGRNKWPLLADKPGIGVTPVPCVFLRVDMPAAGYGIGGRQDRNGQERCRTDRECRPFEVRKPDRQSAHAFLLTTPGDKTRAARYIRCLHKILRSIGLSVAPATCGIRRARSRRPARRQQGPDAQLRPRRRRRLSRQDR